MAAAVVVVALLSVAGPVAGASAAETPHGAAQAASVKLEVRPWGEGRLTIDPPGTDAAGRPAGQVCDRSDLDDFLPDDCERFYPAGTTVTLTPSARSDGTFLGWSDFACPGTEPCRVRLERPETMVFGRFSPLRLGVRLADPSVSVKTDPPGLECPGQKDCVHPFPVGRPVAVVADRALPAAAWPFGCTPSADGQRCTVTLAEDPHWVGVGAGAERPGKAEALFRIARVGEGTVRGRRLDCGSVCERRYDFGVAEELVAREAAGWRFLRWEGECEREQPCKVVVGPVTSVQAVFVRALAPQLLGVAASGTGARRRVMVRVSVQAEAQARIVLRGLSAARPLVDRRYRLRSGANTLSVPVPRGAPRGRYRVTVSVSDGQGGGRVFTVLRTIGR